MLPLIGALGGAALAPTLGIGALGASAIGSGLGTYAQTGSLEKGLMAGLGSYLGGKALSGVMNPAGATDPTMAKEALKQQAVTDAAQGQIAAGVNPSAVQTGIDATAGTGAGAGAGSSTSFLDTPIKPIPGVTPLGSSTDAVTIGNALSTGATTGTIGNALAWEPPKFDMPEEEPLELPDFDPAVDDPTPIMPGSDYRAGYDPEFDYGFAGGGLLSFAEGGEVEDDFADLEEDVVMMNDKEIIEEAIDAIQGESPEPEMVLGEFVRRFGQEALRDLVSGMQEMETNTGEGMVRGPGDGMEDLVPASIDGEQDVLLSEGEFIVPADVVSGLGNGSTDAGADRLHDMMDKVRQMRNGGSTAQPPQVNAQALMPV